MDAREFKTKLLIEQHAERAAIKIVRGINFTHCLKLNNIDPAYKVFDNEGTEIVIQGKDIYNKKTVEKFLAHLDEPIELGWLTGNVGTFANDMANWLRSGGHTKRYQWIKSAAARKWLKNDTARVTAILRMMEHKYATHNFVDDWAEEQMSNILLAKSFSEETNEAINHAVKHNEDAVVLIEKIYLKYLALLDSRKFISYNPLPGLPAGTPDPLSLPDEEEEDGE